MKFKSNDKSSTDESGVNITSQIAIIEEGSKESEAKDVIFAEVPSFSLITECLEEPKYPQPILKSSFSIDEVINIKPVLLPFISYVKLPEFFSIDPQEVSSTCVYESLFSPVVVSDHNKEENYETLSSYDNQSNLIPSSIPSLNSFEKDVNKLLKDQKLSCEQFCSKLLEIRGFNYFE